MYDILCKIIPTLINLNNEHRATLLKIRTRCCGNYHGLNDTIIIVAWLSCDLESRP